MGGEVIESIGKINGTALAPGVSRNGRLYTLDLIKKTAARMSERIADPNGLPIVMRSHHGAGDDPTKIAAVVTSVSVDDLGRARYTADIQDTGAGREIAALTSTQEGNTPALRSVSIHGRWLGSVKRVKHDGDTVETADDMEIDAIDFTAFPGVVAARIETSALGESFITESAEAYVTTNEGAQRWQDGRGVQYELDKAEGTGRTGREAYDADQMKAMAAKGHAMKNADGDPSYPIANVADLKKAIKAVGRGKADHSAIRKHILKRAKALNSMDLIPANWNPDGTVKENASPYRFGEIREYYPEGPGGSASFCIDVSNGPLSLTLRSYSLDPKELRVISAAAMDAANSAMEILDPDSDGDIDVEGAPNADDDDDMGPRLPGMESAFATGGVVTLAASEALGAFIGQGCTYILPKGSPALESGKTVTLDISGSILAESDLRELVQVQVTKLGEHFKPAPEPVEEAEMADDTTETVTAATTDETTTTEESTVTTPAVSETEVVAPAATVTLDVATLAAAIAQAMSVHQAASVAAPVAPAETVTPAVPVAEAAPAVPDATLAESLMAAMLPGLYAQVRQDIIKDFGTPSRRGFRLTESDDTVRTEEQQREDDWKNRAQLIFGDWGATPVPMPGTGMAQTV